MFFPSRTEFALPWLIITFCGWGLWPRLRNRCGATSAAFSIMNVGSQVCMALLYGLTLGTLRAANSEWLNEESFVYGSSWGAPDFPTSRHATVLLGGFILGLADNISSEALQRIPEGIAYLLYGGTCTVLSQSLNFLQVGSKNSGMFLFGMLLVLSGITSTSLSQLLRPVKVQPVDLNIMAPVELHDTATQQAAEEEDPHSLTPPRTPKRKRASNGDNSPRDSLDDDVPVIVEEPNLAVTVTKASVPDGATQKKQTRDAIMLAFFCGLLCGSWSPLSTFAMHNTQLSNVPFVVLMIFPLGQAVALPIIVFVTLRLENRNRATKGLPPLRIQDIFQEIKDLPRTKKAWAVVCGMGINSGYCFYYSATATIPSSAVFGITCCSSIVPLLREVLVTDAFTGAPWKIRIFLIFAFTFYLGAIGVLVSIA